MVEQELSLLDIAVTSVIVLVAAVYLYRRFTKKKSACGGGCGGCSGSAGKPQSK